MITRAKLHFSAFEREWYGEITAVYTSRNGEWLHVYNWCLGACGYESLDDDMGSEPTYEAAMEALKAALQQYAPGGAKGKV